MCYFPTGAELRMCQSRVSGNDSEKRETTGALDLADKGQTFHREPPDQWIGGRSALAAPINKHTEVRFEAEIDPSAKT